MLEPLIVNAPYPSTDGITKDARTIKIISPAYATSTGELNAILQYIYHSFIFSSSGMEEHANTIKRIAIAEMLHLDLLGDMIIALGAQPIYSANPPAYFNFYSTKFVAYGCSLVNMIEDDILAERHAISSYTQMLPRLKEEKVKAVIARILEDEKLHLVTFCDILKDISC
jgi:bacterioferritin